MDFFLKAKHIFSKSINVKVFVRNVKLCFNSTTFILKSSEIVSVQKQPPEVFYKKGVLRKLSKFTGKHLCQSLFFNKAAGLRPATLLKKRLWHRCFPVNFEKFLRTPFLQNTSGRLLLSVAFLYYCFVNKYQKSPRRISITIGNH